MRCPTGYPRSLVVLVNFRLSCIRLQLHHKLITQFLPAVESLMLDEQIRAHAQRLPDALVESAEDIPSTLHKMITEDETVAYIMVYYASHGTSYYVYVITL